MKKFHSKEKITIGVAAYGNLEITKKCFQAIINSIDGNFEIILDLVVKIFMKSGKKNQSNKK